MNNSIDLSAFLENNLFDAGTKLFDQLGISLNSSTESSLELKGIINELYKERTPFINVSEVYFLGLVDDGLFGDTLFTSSNDKISLSQAQSKISSNYEGLMVFAVKFDNYYPKRSDIAELIRVFNRISKSIPVILLVQYTIDGITYLSFASIERTKYIQTWREGEKTGKVSLLKDINISRIHSGHERILRKLRIETEGRELVTNFNKLYTYWQSIFNVQTLNEEFYKDLTKWFYFAQSKVKLPFKPEYIKSEEENIQGFLIRLISRLLFSWFLKEKNELIPAELLELENYEGSRYKILKDIDDDNFLESNSYYRGILQNIFFSALNNNKKDSKKDFICTKYLPKNFDHNLFTDIPFLNGGIFDKLEEDNAKESTGDDSISIPNYLFYGTKVKQKIKKGKKKGKFETVEYPGINQIFKSYKFTVEENTPAEEDIALDPELLGLVFENLLAELDPQIEESVRSSIRKQNGAYYTPRKVIQEMVNESLFLYLFNYIKNSNVELDDYRKKTHYLVYFDSLIEEDNKFCAIVVEALDKLKVLDPACGSGAFPMGMLQRIVQLLKIVDLDNAKWLSLKLERVDAFYRDKFKEQLLKHLDDYSRKLGIIKDSIYGVDIMPLAVQIAKLRFFITLLIEQKINRNEPNYGISPMPNIETKIICANSLRNIEADLFAEDAISNLIIAHEKYYRPEITPEEKNTVADEIVDCLDTAFPSFSEEIYGKKVKGQNKVLLKHWFTHSTIAAPFFNLDFFYPELRDIGGFDIVIGNPPYGGTKLTDEIRNSLDLESKDPYGAFIARFLGNGNNVTPLKNGGVLAYIVSDTFMTIKSHRPLRRQMLNNFIHKMIRVHPDTFKATVNTAIIICERNVFNKNLGVKEKRIADDHYCLMADMTNISIHDDYNKFVEVLYKTEGFEKKETVSNYVYAINYYCQNSIKANSNIPFFVADPSLFVLLNDTSSPLDNEIASNSKKSINPRIIKINGISLRIVKLGNIAENLGGVKTYDNSRFIKSSKGTSGYEAIDSSEIILNLTSKEKTDGVANSKKATYVPFDKSGDMITSDGRLINYWKPIEYYIDWSKKAMDFYSQNNGLRNKHRYFQDGITYSVTGVYAPTFRLNTGYVFGQKGASIFTNFISYEILLGILCSKIIRYLIKNFLSHGVDATDSVIAEIPIPIIDEEYQSKIFNLVKVIIKKLKKDFSYNYEINEQIELDNLMYNIFGLNGNNILEIEKWFYRRYPKLSNQKQKKIIPDELAS